MSEHPKIEIKISGVSGSGKTTAAGSIARGLLVDGFRVRLSDDGAPMVELNHASHEIVRSMRSGGWGQFVEITVCEPGREV